MVGKSLGYRTDGLIAEPASPNPVSDPEAQIEPADRDLIVSLAARIGMTEWPASSDALISVVDAEIFYEMELSGDQIAFVQVSRGHRRPEALFTTQQDAVRYLVFRLADDRVGPGWTPIRHADFAPGTSYDSSDLVLSWPGGRITASAGRNWIDEAREFSWLVTASPAEIAASYLHPNGEPLFDLGIRYQVRTVDPRPEPPRTAYPRPLEIPPPGPTGPSEYAVLDVIAVDNDWQRQPTDRGDVFAYGSIKHRQGRVVSYRGARFHYQNCVDDTYRKTIATFSTAASARRLLGMELGAIWRLSRHGFPLIRVTGPAPGCTVTKNPTEFEVRWTGGTATFNIGPIGQQQALTFSWCVSAALTEITTSYHDPEGRPLFPAGPPRTR